MQRSSGTTSQRRRHKPLRLDRLEDRALMDAGIRPIDGSGNNLSHPDWGSAGVDLLRKAPAAYTDGISAPAGADRPSARVISNTLAAEPAQTTNDRQMSAYVYIWGQFIDHDLDLTQPPDTGGEAFNVPVPAGDPYFDPNNTGTQVIDLTRSRFDPATGTSTNNPRQQPNEITAWIDGSMVYGSDPTVAAGLRTFVGGKLNTSAGNLLPMDAAGNFVAGDVRVNENIELTSIQTLFMREHNRLAGQIAQNNPGLTDEQIYQRARAAVIAEIESITFNQWLPALLGSNVMPSYTGYKPAVNPGIATEFSTAGFRLGHSLINDEVEFFGNDGQPVAPGVALANAFNNPGLVEQQGIDGILKYGASTQAEELDNQIVGGLRNFLFGNPGEGGFDLASLNIQRGRDHGLADYNTVRAAYGLPRVTSFAQISSDPAVQAKLQSLYGTVDNIDLWVGALAENHVPGGSVGPLVRRIVVDQFSRVRDGDRFWFERTFSGGLLSNLENVTLADIIRRNTTITNVQNNVFFLRAQVSGQAFFDRNGNGHRDFGEVALAGVTVQLINPDGEVVATTTTDSNGRYRFTQFRETGSYQVQVVVPSQLQVTTTNPQTVLISRGDTSIGGTDFGIRLADRSAAGSFSHELGLVLGLL